MASDGYVNQSFDVLFISFLFLSITKIFQTDTCSISYIRIFLYGLMDVVVYSDV